MVISFFIGLGWNTVTKGNNWKYLIGFGLAHPASRGAMWRGAKWVAPYAWSATRVLAADAVTVSRAVAATRTAAAVGSGVTLAAAAGVGYTAGAVVGTSIIAVAEEQEIVYQGATADVLDFYLLRGEESATVRDRSAWYESETPILNIPGDAGFIAKHYLWDSWSW
jgi:hypothetical protein